MVINSNIIPRPLTDEEWEARSRGIYDSFANYLVFCPRCGELAKTNMYIMRAEAYAEELGDMACPRCGARHIWTVGYPKNTKTGFVKFKENE